ncbi:putative Acriflavin resistance protein [Vibrio nigripulchritudo SFn27]|uniref:Putative Acriflavin resistance protein n=1 Tax=Vibrio nigripulchritudo TaxID=28173 RepID=U4KGJ0_9VIBR|nr:efflux RND transporter permease subunit [Vibrio nigripulchritudo]CCN84519.1 putative Acriflavin resistance protein [Vibrio nigripulchritudo BLFn1]CCN91012.1 putative Acriflavin resistance protein [Vibrio nigripulchritudo SFn27]CCN95427.1 putative Acriflavin resistance protein [Vibrio nigripulchritudo ENn2]CCO41380.1 putative Acriflavin resistance protein [Vibrio nigripulchritudo SFn135]CCO55893.1 putative Acriflavin resistance protein [Vibrio nigripulchritudo Wn13]
MKGFIHYFASRPMVARVITMMVLLVGVGSASIVKLQELPDVAFAEVTITTQYPGASAQDVELNITNRIEKELRSVQGLRKFTSSSVEGMSEITLELDESSNLTKVVSDIQQAVDRTSGLPKDISAPPLVEQVSTSSFEVFRFGVVTDKSYSELQPYVRDLEKQLRTLPGIGSVSMNGFREREFWIEVDPVKANRYRLSLDQIISAVKSRNLSQSGGVVESWNSDQRIVTLTQIQSVKELENTIIASLPSGEIIRVKDVGSVKDDFERSTQVSVINGEKGVLFTLSKSAHADIKATIAGVLGFLERQSQQTNGEFRFPVALNLADDMSSKFSIVSVNGGVGLVLVLLVLSLILKRQVAFWVSVSIPFSVLGVVILLPAYGMNLDSITLAAMLLVIGIIVDDSVIVAESVYREYQRGKSGLEAAIAGTQKVIKPIIASLTTTALVFIPMFFIPGTLGKAVVVIPITVITALLFSLAECTFTLPAHLASSLEKEGLKNSKPDKFNALTEQYQRLLSGSLNHKKKVLGLSVVVLGIGSFLVTFMKLDFFPAQAAKYIEVYTEVAPGTPNDQLRQQHEALEKAIQNLPESELSSYQMTYGSPVSRGQINLTDFDQRSRTADEISNALLGELSLDKKLEFVKFSVDAGGPPPGEPVEIRVIGNKLVEREHAVSLVQSWMQDHQGLNTVTNSESLKDAQLKIIPQHEWLARYNLTVQDLASTLRIAFDGEQVTSTWLADEEVNLRVILTKEYRNLQKLSTTKIYTANGEQVPLSRLATVEQYDSPREILHYNGDRQIMVTAQIIDENLTPDEISSNIARDLANKVGDSVILDIGGEAESTNETFGGILIAFPAALLGIYFVLVIMFNSMLQPLLVMSVIPFALVASLMALLVHLQDISLFALIGALGMMGVVVNNTLVLINQINVLREQGYASYDAVIEAASSRLRPILLTSITTVVGLIPLAYGLGGTDVYMGPMSLTLGYGLLFSLPVVLFVVPCLYLLCFGRSQVSESRQ